MYLVVIAATVNIALKNEKKNISTGDAKENGGGGQLHNAPY